MNWDCLTFAAAGKGLSFPLGLHSPPICLAEIQLLTACPQARAQQAAEPGQGLLAAKREWCCIHIFGTSLPVPAHMVLLPCFLPSFSSGTLQVLPGTNLSLQNGIALECYGTGNMPVWLQGWWSFYCLFCASEHWWDVVQFTPQTTEQQGEADREHHYRWWQQQNFDWQVSKPALQSHMLLCKIKCCRKQTQARTTDEGSILNITSNVVGSPLDSYWFKSLHENYQRECDLSQYLVVTSPHDFQRVVF